MNTLSIVRDAFRSRITRAFPEQIRAAIAPLTDEQIWWRPNESSNSIGNLVLHLSGSLNTYLNRNIGGIEYVRDRDAEFAQRREIPKHELLAIFDDMIAKADRTFEALTDERLGDPSPEPKMYAIVFEDLLAVATHLASHTGQILWIAKMFEARLDDVWIRTHKSDVWRRQNPLSSRA